jgi:hypothetical protein
MKEIRKERRLVTAKELAAHLGVNLLTVYRSEEKGQIKNYGIGRSKRYDLNEVLKLHE